MGQIAIYRDMLADASVVDDGLQLFTADSRASDRGFVPFGFERSEIQQYVTTVAPDDPDVLLPGWKLMPAQEICDLLDFWDAAPWPLPRDEVQRLAVERFGWTIEVDDGTPYLMNTVSGFTIPDVSTIGAGSDLHYLSLRIADVIREVTPASEAFLGDGFARAVREGARRWGAPTLRSRVRGTSAEWRRPSGAEIFVNARPKGLSAMFKTPQGAALDRKAGY